MREQHGVNSHAGRRWVSRQPEMYNNANCYNFNGTTAVLLRLSLPPAPPTLLATRKRSLANWPLDLQSTAFRKRVTCPPGIYNSQGATHSPEVLDYRRARCLHITVQLYPRIQFRQEIRERCHGDSSLDEGIHSRNRNSLELCFSPVRLVVERSRYITSGPRNKNNCP